MQLSSFPLTLVVKADGTDSNREEVQKFIYNEHSAEYIQGDDAGGPGLQGWIGGKGERCICIHTGAGKGGRKGFHTLLPLTLALLHTPRHSSKQTLQMGSGPGNLHTKREQVKTNSNSSTIQPREAQSHHLKQWLENRSVSSSWR